VFSKSGTKSLEQFRRQIAGFRRLHCTRRNRGSRPINGVELCKSMHLAAGFDRNIGPSKDFATDASGGVHNSNVSGKTLRHYRAHARTERSQLLC